MRGPAIKYPSLAQRLRYDITQGTYKPGQKLPTTRELAATLDVTRKTLSKALKILTEEGLLEVTPGRGCYVTGDRHTDTAKDKVECHLLNTTRPGTPLPSTATLSKETDTSPATVRRVLNNLIQRHVLYRNRGHIFRA